MRCNYSPIGNMIGSPERVKQWIGSPLPKAVYALSLMNSIALNKNSLT
jgi:hypothetical protein